MVEKSKRAGWFSEIALGLASTLRFLEVEHCLGVRPGLPISDRDRMPMNYGRPRTASAKIRSRREDSPDPAS